jgi:hypothetical protein
MKRSLLVIAAVSVLGLILGGFSLFGHSGTAKAATFSVPISSIPGGPPSGVTGTVNYADLGGGVVGASTVVGAAGLSPFFANVPVIFFFSSKDCDDATAVVGVEVWHAAQADQNITPIPTFPGVTGPDGFGNLTFGVDNDGSTVIINTATLSPYVGGAAGIASVGISTLPGYNPAQPYTQVARVQHLACGNADGSPVLAWGGVLSSSWRLPDPACDINEDLVCDAGDIHYALDMDVTNGTGPCNPIDPSATHMVGDTYQVAICLVSASVYGGGAGGGPPAAFDYQIQYDKTLNQCTTGTGTAPNPDANCNGTYCVAFSTPDLGDTGWDCSGVGAALPTCDLTASDPAGNPNIATAYDGCFTTGTPTLPTGDTVAAPVSEITLKALAVGTDTLTFVEATESDAATNANLVCPPANPGDVVRCFNGTDIKAVPPTPTNTATATTPPTGTPIPPTATPTNTATPTPTFTPVPGVRMQKTCPDGSSNCNLWIEKTCVDPTTGKGCLEIDEHIYGIADTCDPNVIGCTVPEGLGAWEHELFWDKQFVSVSTTPVNTWLTSGGRVIPPNGCFVQILNEQSLLEGCVTKDTNPPTGAVGPEGDGVVEKIIITPNLQNIMQAYGMRATKDNGIVTTIADKDCEVTDTLGEALPGTLPGQLTVVCSNATITIRMLEGDLDLNCKIDVADDQAEAFHYGATVGLQLYNQWYDLEPKWTDGDIDIKDLQFVFGRNYSTCDNPIPNDQGVPLPPIDP